MKIPPPAISSPDTHQQLNISSRTETLPPLFVGEVVDAEVLNNSSGGKVPILLKNSRIVADSPVPFEKGDRIAVTVTRLHPRVVLQIVRSGILERSGTLREYIQRYRADPRCLFKCLARGCDVFDPGGLGALAAHLGEEEVRGIRALLKSLIFTGEGSRRGMFLKEYLSTLGYLMEHEPGTTPGRMDGLPQLRDILITLSERLQLLMDTEKLPGTEILARFVRSMMTAIDVHQVMNGLFQEYENKYVFQIPLRLPERMGLAEIVVQFERHQGRRGDKRILFLLTMDVLGDVTVEAVVRDNGIGCEFTCTDETVTDFIRLNMGELEEGLAALGYGIHYMRCAVKQDGAEMRARHEGVTGLPSRYGVDIVV